LVTLAADAAAASSFMDYTDDACLGAVAAAEVAADFDGDSGVDGADFLVWQRQRADAMESPEHGAGVAAGDVDGDGAAQLASHTLPHVDGLTESERVSFDCSARPGRLEYPNLPFRTETVDANEALAVGPLAANSGASVGSDHAWGSHFLEGDPDRPVIDGALTGLGAHEAGLPGSVKERAIDAALADETVRLPTHDPQGIIAILIGLKQPQPEPSEPAAIQLENVQITSYQLGAVANGGIWRTAQPVAQQLELENALVSNFAHDGKLSSSEQVAVTHDAVFEQWANA
jgi:hypothetical protein